MQQLRFKPYPFMESPGEEVTFVTKLDEANGNKPLLLVKDCYGYNFLAYADELFIEETNGSVD